MKRLIIFVLALSAAIVAGVIGFVVLTDRMPGDVKNALENAEQLELYSLSGGLSRLHGTDTPVPWETLHDYGVNGKTVITDEKTKRLVLDAVFKGVNEGNKAAMCFNPRHALRATRDGKTVDLVICFECFQIKLYRGGQEAKDYLMISTSPEETLDKVLTDAGVKLAPKPKK